MRSRTPCQAPARTTCGTRFARRDFLPEARGSFTPFAQKTRRGSNWPWRVKFITKHQRTFRLRRDVPSKSAHILNAVETAVNANEAGMAHSNENEKLLSAINNSPSDGRHISGQEIALLMSWARRLGERHAGCIVGIT